MFNEFNGSMRDVTQQAYIRHQSAVQVTWQHTSTQQTITHLSRKMSTSNCSLHSVKIIHQKFLTASETLNFFRVPQQL